MGTGSIRRGPTARLGSRLTPGPALLQGLIKCAACGGTFQVNGSHGRYLGCSGYKRGLCQSKTRLSRRLAEDRLLSFFAERVFAQPEWLEAVVESTRQSWEHSQRQEPSERDDL